MWDIWGGFISLTSIPDINTALMRPRRPKQYCLPLVIYIYIYIYIYINISSIVGVPTGIVKTFPFCFRAFSKMIHFNLLKNHNPGIYCRCNTLPTALSHYFYFFVCRFLPALTLFNQLCTSVDHSEEPVLSAIPVMIKEQAMLY